MSDCLRVGRVVKGYCPPHYQQHYRGKVPGALRPKRSAADRDTEGRKHCRACDQWLATDRFSSHRGTTDGLQVICRRCQTLSKYKVTHEWFEGTLASQGGACAICRSETPGGRGFWHIDHDHSCCPGAASCGSCVRGILCSQCNTGLGLFRDDPIRISSSNQLPGEDPMTNPFAGFVARMDTLVPLLEAGTLDDEQRVELVDLTRRAMFALVNHINAQAHYMQALMLPVEGEVVPDGTEGTSLE